MPVVVPCHRVVRSDGSMNGYRGGAEAKRTLLTLEAA
jgi:methylated-DNA-[protein]-cysteine S-methyltransferase